MLTEAGAPGASVQASDRGREPGGCRVSLPGTRAWVQLLSELLSETPDGASALGLHLAGGLVALATWVWTHRLASQRTAGEFCCAHCLACACLGAEARLSIGTADMTL